MAQELVAKTCAFGSTFDQARDVGDHKALLRPDAHDTQIRVQGCEWIVRDFGPRIRDRRDQRALAGVRHAEQADVGQHAQLELELFPLSRPARRFLPRCAIGTGLEVQVAEAAVTSLADQYALTRHQQFGKDLIGFDISEDRPHRHAQDDVGARRTKLVRTTPGLAVACFVATRIAIVDQCVEVQIGAGEDAAATPTVAAIGAAEGYELLAPETRAARTTVAGGNIDRGFIDELHVRIVEAKKPRRAGASRAETAVLQAGLMLTVWRFSAPLIANCTCPSTSANSV